MQRILVVEDSRTQAEQLRATLEEAGFAVEVAPDGERGFALFDATGFDLVITDIIMPRMNGYELCRRLKAHPTRGWVPVLLLTTLRAPLDILQGIECGADKFLTKPYHPKELLAHIRYVLATRPHRGRARVRGRVKVGIEMSFLGKTFTITSENEQILDLLIATCEDIVRTHGDLRASQDELEAAKAQVEQRNAQLQRAREELEERVKERTAELAQANEALRQEVEDRKRLEAQLLHAQKMDAVGRLAGGVAHDFNNLLTIITGYGELLLAGLRPDEPLRGLAAEITRAGERAAALTRQLLAFSRQQVVAPKVLDLNAIVTDVSKMLQRLIGEDVVLATALAPNLGRVKADPTQVEQVLLNLAVNARDAMPRGGKLTVETANVDLDEAYAHTHPEVQAGRHVLLAVSDTGCGMTEEVKARIFEPFFTTKELGKGTGLGLATVYGVVKQSGGSIAVYTEVGRGTTFKVYLPRLVEMAETTRGGPAAPPIPRGSETLLLVEDEAGVRALARHALQASGYTVLEASNGVEALRLADQYGAPIRLLVTDVVMPGMGGRELHAQLTALYPGLKVLFMSGYTDDAVFRHGVLEAGLPFLQKPFTVDALARKVRETLDREQPPSRAPADGALCLAEPS
ncbi:MAG: response regulator [Gemmataceae bacterium]|nr:response regulator [Gemmataceae bacterium]